VRVEHCDDIGELAARQWYADSGMFAEVRAIRPIADSLMHLQGRALEGDQDVRDVSNVRVDVEVLLILTQDEQLSGAD